MSASLNLQLFVSQPPGQVAEVSGVTLGAAESGPNASALACPHPAAAAPFLFLSLALVEDVKLWVRLKHSHTSSRK